MKRKEQMACWLLEWADGSIDTTELPCDSRKEAKERAIEIRECTGHLLKPVKFVRFVEGGSK